MPEPSEVPFFEQAIREMKKSTEKVRVGAVLVHRGLVVATGHRSNGVHAERAAITQAAALGIPFKEAVLYTTLEPCVDVQPGQTRGSCADLIIQAGIPEVAIGRYDPNPLIQRKGWRALRDAGVRLRDFPETYRQIVDHENAQFMDFFKEGIGPIGGAKVDHKTRASFRVQFSETDRRHIDIGWTLCGKDSVYGVGAGDVSVTLARYARKFEEIDDPSAFEFSHAAEIGIDEIGIFKGPGGFVLVRPTEIHSGPKYSKEDYFVSFRFKVLIDKDTQHGQET